MNHLPQSRKRKLETSATHHSPKNKIVLKENTANDECSPKKRKVSKDALFNHVADISVIEHILFALVIINTDYALCILILIAEMAVGCVYTCCGGM